MAQTTTEMIGDFEEQLAACQYPRVWQIREKLDITTERALEHATYALDETSLLEVELPFNHLIVFVALAYEHSLSGDIEKALEVLSRGEAKLKALEKNQNTYPLKPAFLHILKATELSFLIQKKDVIRAPEVASTVSKVESLDHANQTAVLYGFPGLFVRSFGLDGVREARKCFLQANKNDHSESIWYYAEADCIGELERAERIVDKMPGHEEFALIEKALEIKRTAIYTSYYAGMYRQSSKELDRRMRVLHSRRSDEPRIHEFNQKAWNLYKESLQLNPSCPETSLRCARGFILLPEPFQDLSFAKNLLDQVFAIAPDSPFANHVMAEYYKITRDTKKAMDYYRVCERRKLYGSTMALIRLEYQCQLHIDFIQRFENLLDVYETDVERVQILFELLTYCMDVLNDWPRIREYTDRILGFGALGDFMLQCRPSGAFCSKGFRKETLYNLLVEKIRRAGTETESAAEKSFYTAFLERLLPRKILAAGPVAVPDNKDNLWRREGTTATVSPRQPTLSWRKQRVEPSIAQHDTQPTSGGRPNFRTTGGARGSTSEHCQDVTGRMWRMRVQDSST